MPDHAEFHASVLAKVELRFANERRLSQLQAVALRLLLLFGVQNRGVIISIISIIYIYISHWFIIYVSMSLCIVHTTQLNTLIYDTTHNTDTHTHIYIYK